MTPDPSHMQVLIATYVHDDESYHQVKDKEEQILSLIHSRARPNHFNTCFPNTMKHLYPERQKQEDNCCLWREMITNHSNEDKGDCHDKTNTTNIWCETIRRNPSFHRGHTHHRAHARTHTPSSQRSLKCIYSVNVAVAELKCSPRCVAATCK